MHCFLRVTPAAANNIQSRDANNNLPDIQNLWKKEFEAKSLWGNRIFCFTFLAGYPLSCVIYYLNGNPDYKSILLLQLACSSLVAIFIFLNFKGKINGPDASFYSRMLLVIVHSVVLALYETVYFYDMNINLTLQLIFCGIVLRWNLSYAIIASVTTILFFTIGLYIKGPDVLVLFLKEGGFF